MYSSEDLEKFYFDYQTERMPRGMSIKAYCSRNNVPYRILDKWIRDVCKRVVPVQVTGTPEELKKESSKQREKEKENQSGNDTVSIKVSISTGSGMEVSREGMDYRSLRLFIEKLEGLLC